MFRRTKQETSATVVDDPKPGGKGRPTPTRKEIAAAQRGTKSENSARVRQGMRNGEERYLLPRDKGPVRRFIRDFVDARFSFIELIIPLLIVTMVLGYSGNARAAGIGNALLFGSILLVIFDMLWLRFRMRRQLAERFPDVPLKGTTYYALTRAMQMKFMRLPKPKVKIGQELPENYK